MKAQFKTIEASIAVIILFSIVSWLLRFAPQIPEIESLDVKLTVLRAIKTLDLNDELRQLIYSNDTQSIEQKLFVYIPRKFNYKVLVCENSCGLSVEAKKVYSISYLFSTDLKTFSNKELVVYVWEA